MRFIAVELLTVSNALLTHAAPFLVQDGELQRHRRRAVDYPVQYVKAPQPARQLHERSAAPYSVVQVDGESPNTAAPPAPPATMTVTQPGSMPSPSTQTVIVTSVIPGPTSDQTVVMTTTQEVFDGTTLVVTATPPVVTSNFEAPVALPQATVTSVSSYTFIAQLSATTQQQQDPVTNTVVQTVTTTDTSSTPTAYYDDGMWHTYYPIKDFQPPPFSTSTAAVDVSAAQETAGRPTDGAATVVGLQNSSTSQEAQVATGSAGWKKNRRWVAPTLASYAEKWVAFGGATPEAYISGWANHQRSVKPDCTPTPGPYVEHPETGRYSGDIYAPKPTDVSWGSPEEHNGLRIKARKAPEDLKTANWIATRR